MTSQMDGHVTVQAKKRVIQTLTVVIGPVAAGKSTFTERLVCDVSLRKALSLPLAAPVLLSRDRVERLPQGRIEHLIMQYGLLSPLDRAIRHYDRDPLLDLFCAARDINFFTMVTPRDQLREQLKQRDLIWDQGHPGHEMLYELYAKPNFLRTWYDLWFDFCSSQESLIQNVIVENCGDYRFLPAQQRRKILDIHFPRCQ